MSTILEALKKSEQERKLNKVPTLSNMQAPVEQSVWPLRAAILLCFLLLVAVIWFASNWLSDNRSSRTEAGNAIVLNNATVEAQKRIDIDDDSLVIDVNVVSFSEQAEQRFVMINGKMFRQGEFVEPGLKVDEILPDSVLLNRRGERIEKKP